MKSAIPWLQKATKPSGRILIGELVWAKIPSQGFLDFLGCKLEDQPFADDVEREITANGLSIVDSFQCSSAEFETYERKFRDGIVSWCENHPDDSDSPSFRKRIDAWTDAREKWGRSEFGFHVVVAGH